MNKLWVEKYRPKTLDDVVFGNTQQYNFFKSIISEKKLPNLLFVGHQGTGKTSLSGALLNDLNFHPEDILRVNCSDDKIDKIRKDVKNFAYTMPIGSTKVVQLEELDYLSLEGQALLRSLIEEVSSTCRFIGTANYQNKIIPAIKDRFSTFVFQAPNKDAMLLKVAEILEQEKIEFSIEDLEKLLSVSYPSLRKMIHLAETSSKNGVLNLVSSETSNDWKFEVLSALEQNNFCAVRTILCSNVQPENASDIFTFLYSNIHKAKIDQDQGIILIAEYMYKHAFASDPEINIAAMCIELSLLVK